MLTLIHGSKISEELYSVSVYYRFPLNEYNLGGKKSAKVVNIKITWIIFHFIGKVRNILYI